MVGHVSRRWTPEEEELAVRLWREGHSFAEVARRVGRTYDATRTRLYKKFGLARTRQQPLTQEQREQAKKLWAEGLTVRRIADQVGTEPSRLYEHIRDHRRQFPFRYDTSGADWVPDAIEMRKQGMTHGQIAERCGVNPWAVQRRLALAGLAKAKGRQGGSC